MEVRRRIQPLAVISSWLKRRRNHPFRRLLAITMVEAAILEHSFHGSIRGLIRYSPFELLRTHLDKRDCAESILVVAMSLNPEGRCDCLLQNEI